MGGVFSSSATEQYQPLVCCGSVLLLSGVTVWRPSAGRPPVLAIAEDNISALYTPANNASAPSQHLDVTITSALSRQQRKELKEKIAFANLLERNLVEENYDARMHQSGLSSSNEGESVNLAAQSSASRSFTPNRNVSYNNSGNSMTSVRTNVNSVRTNVNYPTGVRNPSNSSTPVRNPGNSSTPVRNPGNSFTPVRNPGNSSTPVRNPGNSFTPVRNPGNSFTPVRNPGNSAFKSLPEQKSTTNNNLSLSCVSNSSSFSRNSFSSNTRNCGSKFTFKANTSSPKPPSNVAGQKMPSEKELEEIQELLATFANEALEDF